MKKALFYNCKIWFQNIFALISWRREREEKSGGQEAPPRLLPTWRLSSPSLLRQNSRSVLNPWLLTFCLCAGRSGELGYIGCTTTHLSDNDGVRWWNHDNEPPTCPAFSTIAIARSILVSVPGQRWGEIFQFIFSILPRAEPHPVEVEAAVKPLEYQV